MEQSKALAAIEAIFSLDDLNKRYIERTAWGHKYNLHYSNNTIIDLLFMDKDGFTSMHFHRRKMNRLFCINGLIKIDYFDSSSYARLNGTKFLGNSGNTRVIDIMPKIIHRLTAMEESLLIEIDSTRSSIVCSKEDIVRLDKGMMQ